MNTLHKNEEQGAERVDDRQWLVPPVDIFENEEELLVIADVPGADEGAIRLQLDKNELTLEAPRESRDWGAELGRECCDEGFRRRFVLPSGIDGSKISAELKHGVLHVHLPKAEELKPRRIMIKAR